MVVLAVIGVVVAVVLGAGIYMTYEAPFMLSEAAFEVIPVPRIVRNSCATWIPFGISPFLAWDGALVVHLVYPEVTRISE